MGPVGRLGGGILAVVFLAALLGRSLSANPAIRSFLQGGRFHWSMLLALPLVALSIVILALRVRDDFGEDEEPGYESRYTPVESNSWDVTSGAGSTDESPLSAESGDPGDSDVGIEGEPPEASLRDHLEHLRTELGGDEDARRELHRLESVVDEVGDEPAVPRRCPGEHCDAIWSERTIFRGHRGQYAVLDDGERVQCLECERIVPLE